MGLKYMSSDGKALIYRNNGETLRIEPWGKDSLRVRSVMMGEFITENYALLPREAEEGAEIVTAADPGAALHNVGGDPGSEAAEDIRFGRITNGKIRAEMYVDTWRNDAVISFFNSSTGELLFKEEGPGGALNKHSRCFKPRVGGDFELTVSFRAREKEHLYGMGQYQQELLDIKGCTLELAHRNSQASVPFVLSDAGYGFLWNNPSVGHVSFGRNVTQWYASSTPEMDYWITVGDTPDDIERNYSEATGRVPMMPEYGLGFWQCKLRYWNQEELLEIARTYHKKGVRVDVIVCDFYHWPHCGDWRFDPYYFPDPKAMIDELKSYGMELMVSIWPQVNVDSENYKEMVQRGLLMKAEYGIDVVQRCVGENSFYDATNPEARAYVWEKVKKNYYDDGIRVFWLDEAEPEIETYDYENYRYHMGSALKVSNIYPLVYAKTFFDGMTSAGQDKVVNLLRCAWAGSQRYGALVWSGDISSDWETFRRQICAGLNMGIAGIPWWTTDIGGFGGANIYDEKFHELLVRWFEWGTFCPVMRLHGDRDPHTPVKQSDGTPGMGSGASNEIWSYGPAVEEILTSHIMLRERMRDYTRSLMEEAHEVGRPVMRPLFYEFPGDANTWEIKDEYFFGADLLVAPVLSPDARQREVYLPEGASWTEVHTGKTYEGGSTVTADAPLEYIPVFARDGRQAELFA